MDRCHRIGQHKPVLVLRLATAHSVEGRMLKRARSKLALERLVIKKGAFLHQQVCKILFPQRSACLSVLSNQIANALMHKLSVTFTAKMNNVILIGQSIKAECPGAGCGQQ